MIRGAKISLASDSIARCSAVGFVIASPAVYRKDSLIKINKLYIPAVASVLRFKLRFACNLPLAWAKNQANPSLPQCPPIALTLAGVELVH